MSDPEQTISKEDWQKKLAKIAEDGSMHGLAFGWLGLPLVVGLALAFVAGLPGLALNIGVGAVLLGSLGMLLANRQGFYKWESDKVKNISYKKNRTQAYLTGFLLHAPALSPLLWPISFIVKNSMKATENSSSLKQAAAQTITAPILGISTVGKTLFGNPVLAQEKQAAAAEKAAELAKAEPVQITTTDTPAPAIAVAAPVIAELPIRPARSTIGNNRVTVRLPGAAPGEGA